MACNIYKLPQSDCNLCYKKSAVQAEYECHILYQCNTSCWSPINLRKTNHGFRCNTRSIKYKIHQCEGSVDLIYSEIIKYWTHCNDALYVLHGVFMLTVLNAGKTQFTQLWGRIQPVLEMHQHGEICSRWCEMVIDSTDKTLSQG
jgi:hypothetical protein